MALQIAKKGLDVVITYHSNQAAAEDVVAQIKKSGVKSVALKLDTSDVSTFDDFYGRLEEALKETMGSSNFDFLLNNAGTGIYKPFLETT